MAHPLLALALISAGVAAAAKLSGSGDPKRLDVYTRRHRRPARDVWEKVRVRSAGKVTNASGEVLEVVEVDGEKVRDLVDIDFVAGGNPGRYAYVPHGQIWVESHVSPKDKAATVLHEVHEDDRMRHGGLSYEAAHDEALALERRFRRRADGRSGNRQIERWLRRK